MFYVSLVLLALYFWRVGHTPTAHVLVIPFLVVGLFWGGNLGRAIGLAVILCGVAGLLVDHTSEHNARA
jgi:hypothetical protein